MDSTAWPQGFANQMPPFGAQFENSQTQEDWEDWLRWDPTAEPAAVSENGASNSGSSKNDSPLQEAAWPVGHDAMGLKVNQQVVPPVIVGEDGLDFGTESAINNEPFVFGNPGDSAANFAFDDVNNVPPQPHGFPKLNTNTALWPLPSNVGPDANISLSALSNETSYQYPTAPGTATTSSPHNSPESSVNRRSSGGSTTSPPAQGQKKRGGRKRKVQPEPETQEDDGSLEEGDGPPVKKTSHNVIEKRYRNNLNDKIVELKNSVPSLRAMHKVNKGEEEDLEGLTAAHKHNKATIMAKATEYIKHLERRNNNLSDEMAQLKARLNAVETAIGKNRDRQASVSSSGSPGTSYSARARQHSSSSQTTSPGYLNVPQDQGSFTRSPVQQYQQPQGMPSYNQPPNPPVDAQNAGQYRGNRSGGLVNKVMLGTMAGLMAMEGYSEQQNNDGTSHSRLGAIPTWLWKRGATTTPSSSAAAFSLHAALPLLKTCLVIGAVLYLIAPLLSFSPRPKEKTHAAVRLPHVPSLASPVEVRRKAWLTALQSVWVPKHFLLEVVAVTAKMIKLSVRRLIGTETFNAIAGTSQEEEIARIKAWDIAVDAQLAGGDAEVSYYRLLLTLMASGTLPDSPTRLMQKAVHFRVFFWEVANAGYGNLIMFKQLTEKVGRIYWDSARKMQKDLVYAKAQGRPTDDDGIEVLPDHLARLLELDCDEVLGDEMVQRAWNLAWNKPSAHHTTANAARDSVVEDHAIRSPLDAVAAWYANMAIDDTLADALHNNVSSQDTEYYINLAVSVAPPASTTQARALAAKAILSNSRREKNVIAALEALPVTSPTAGMALVTQTPASPDTRTALTLAKLLSLLAPSNPTTARSNAFDLLAALHLPPTSFTLLTAVATFKLLQVVSNEKRLASSARYGAEDVASNLRVWVGTTAGRQAGLNADERGRLVDACLAVAKRVGGWEGERDSGYGGSLEGSPVRAEAGAGVV